MLLVVSASSSGLRAVGQHWGVSGAGRAVGRDVPLLPSAALMTEQGGEEICQAEPGAGLNPHHRPWLSSGSIIPLFVCLLNN